MSTRSVCAHHTLTLSSSFSLIVFAAAYLFDPTWLLSAHAEWSTWWDHSWYSSAPWFSAQYYGNQLQSRDWTTSSSQPQVTYFGTGLHTYIVHNCCPTAAAQTWFLYAHVWLDPGGFHEDSTVLPHSASGRFHSCCSTQCLYHRRLHTTLDFRFQRCFSKDLSRRTVPLLIHGDISGVAQCNVEFKDAVTQTLLC